MATKLAMPGPLAKSAILSGVDRPGLGECQLRADSPLPAQKQAASIRIPAVISDVRNVSENTSFHQRNNTKSVEQVSTCLREFWLQVSVQPLQQGQGQAKQPLPSRCP